MYSGDNDQDKLNDYGDEDYNGVDNDQNQMDEDGEANGADDNNADAEDDQYFEDAGDVGYLPADHVRKT